MIQRGQFLRPGRFGGGDGFLAGGAAGITGRRGQPVKNAGGNLVRIADNTHGHRLGQADTVGVDVDLNDLCIFRPVIDAVTGQGRERVEPRAKCQHDIGLGNQLHPCL